MISVILIFTDVANRDQNALRRKREISKIGLKDDLYAFTKIR